MPAMENGVHANGHCESSPSSSGRSASSDVPRLQISTIREDRVSTEVPFGGNRTTRSRLHSEPFFIGVAGGTASGKTTVCSQIMQRLNDQCVVMLAQDSFYRGLTPEESANASEYNFDHPDAIDTAALVQCMQDLRAMRPVEIPIYDFETHSRKSETRRVEPADVVLVEGILVLHMPAILAMLNMKVFVDTDDDVRLARRVFPVSEDDSAAGHQMRLSYMLGSMLQRDLSVRGRDVAGVLQQYTKFVKPAHDAFVAPSRRSADVIIPWARNENDVAIDLITQHIHLKLQQPDLQRIYHNLVVVPSNYQMRGMHTIVRCRDTPRHEFVFYADRLLRLVVEAGLGFLPFCEKEVCTPTGARYVGVDFAKRLCGVSLIRSGESMETALRACCQGIKIGKILVHREKNRPDKCAKAAAMMRQRSLSLEHLNWEATEPSNGGCNGSFNGSYGGSQSRPTSASMQPPGKQPQDEELIYEKLPVDIAQRHVLLLDPVLATGTSAARAVQVLESRGVDQGKILFLTLIAAPEGIHHMCSRFPRLKLITTEIDECVCPDTFHVMPGIGEFADRYFCD